MSGTSGLSRALPPLLGAALLAAFGLGYVLGRGEATPTQARTASPGASPRLAPRARAAPRADNGRARSEEQEHGAEVGAPGERAPEPAVDLDASLALARAAAQEPADEQLCDQAQDAAEALERAILLDPAARAGALGRLRAASDPAELELLAAVLGRVKDLAVEEVALELIRAASPAQQAAGYDMLDALDLPSARLASLEGLARAREPAVRRAALSALPAPVGASLDDAREVVGALAGLVRADPDPELRRRAAVELGRWHRGPEDLGPVLAALERDPDPNVRAGAAFGLELAARRDPAVVEALVRAVRRPDEDPLVRENAWKALGALGPLAPEVQAEWRRFEAELGARGEG